MAGKPIITSDDIQKARSLVLCYAELLVAASPVRGALTNDTFNQWLVELRRSVVVLNEVYAASFRQTEETLEEWGLRVPRVQLSAWEDEGGAAEQRMEAA